VRAWLANFRTSMRRDARRVSLAIPVHNRPQLVCDALHYPRQDHRVGEIVVFDDGSDARAYEEMLENLPDDPKLTVIRRGENRGPFCAKFHAVRNCRHPWVVLLDSDNAISSSYLDRLFALQRWDSNVIYCPDFARPHFGFREFAGEVIDMPGARRLFDRHSHRTVSTLLNTGNYFVHRETYTRRLANHLSYQLPAADVFAANYLWMRSGGKLQIVPRLRYRHRVHDDSNFSTTGRSNRGAWLIRDSIINRDELDFERLASTFR